MDQKNKRIRALATLTLCLCMIVSLFSGLGVACAAEPELLDGSYEGVGQGRNGDIVLSVTLQGQAITAIDVIAQNETPRIWEKHSRCCPGSSRPIPPRWTALPGRRKAPTASRPRCGTRSQRRTVPFRAPAQRRTPL